MTERILTYCYKTTRQEHWIESIDERVESSREFNFNAAFLELSRNLALSLFARGTSSYATARCRSTTVPSSTCMHYQPLDQTRQILSKGL
ncbi:hypothetical protein HOLleu_29906 [Holothuria leucospilota]|uniref:Uncharacterized protein n=1 Tax=Holothuria leucospilota TaxID=206669 RepID=A0A9Q1GW55_HOLLE|nr:hypothetical protein HOLleu_29906 [Holothuria leucospilota]